MASLLELATEIVKAHSTTTILSTHELVSELHEVHAALQALEKGESVPSGDVVPEEALAISKRKAFGRNKVTCMICGQEMKTLSRHLKTAHGLRPADYRKQFDIPRSQPLAARAYSESRRQMAVERGLGANLAKARAARGKGKGRRKQPQA